MLLGVWKVANMGIVQTLWDTVSLTEGKMCEEDTHHKGLPMKFSILSALTVSGSQKQVNNGNVTNEFLQMKLAC